MDIHPAEANYISNESVDSQFPGKSFLDVVENELGRHCYSALVIGGGIAEITNLDTKTDPEANLSEFKDKVIKTSKQIFSLAESALHEYPSDLNSNLEANNEP